MTLTLPQPKAVLDLLSMFLGSRPPLAPGSGIDLSLPPFGTYVTWLKGQNGEVEGAIFADLPAALYLGGELIMMPEQSLREMQKKGQASEAILDALGEVFNNLRGLLNRTATNPHVTPTTPETYAGLDLSNGWVLTPSHRVDLVGVTPLGQGCISLVSR